MLKKLIIKLLREVATKIEEDKCELTKEESSQLFTILAHEPLSKEQACDYLNVSRATFDNWIRNGFIHKGKKRKGFNELVWYKDEISNPFDS